MLWRAVESRECVDRRHKNFGAAGFLVHFSTTEYFFYIRYNALSSISNTKTFF